MPGPPARTRPPVAGILARLRRPESTYARLPERVRLAISGQQDSSEILIGWFQLAVVLTFGVLWLISPKTAPGDASIVPVPWILSIYLVLTVARLGWAIRARLPGWVLAASVVLDMALLMVLIWSFHIQYDQPASFFLKAPTLLYVFIFIALRALRFEVRYVLLAGVVAALGWLALVLYVITVDPENTMITRDYVAYMTSNSILLGAEFDKIISILVVTAILAVALARARGLLVASVADHTAAAELSRFFSPEVADRIKGADTPVTAGHGELREVAILSVDLRGFTALAREIAPDAVIQLLAEYQARTVPVIRDGGGAIDKFMGDGIMATFGAVGSSEAPLADAMRTVAALVVAIDDWNAERRQAGLAPMGVGMAVTGGPVVFGAVGTDTRLEYTVIGDAVNLAAKLEKATRDEGVRALTTAASWQVALDQGHAPAATPETRPGSTVAGIREPVDLVVLAA